MVVVNIEDVKRMIAERKALNVLPLAEIEWHENGKPVQLDRVAVADFEYTGLLPIDFVTSGALDAARLSPAEEKQEGNALYSFARDGFLSTRISPPGEELVIKVEKIRDEKGERDDERKNPL